MAERQPISMRLETGGEQARPWLTVLCALCYTGLLAALVLLPGGSLLEHLRWLDSGICAQLPTHSFYPGGERLPLCARNTGIYFGFSVTLLTLFALGRGRAERLPPWPILLVLGAGVVAMVLDGFNSFLTDLALPHIYQPHNLARLVTGLLTGLALAICLLPMLNRLFWRSYDSRRSVPSWKTLLLLLPGLILGFFAVASQSFIALYPVALLSTLGLVAVLGSINLIVLISVRRRDETFTRYLTLLPYLTCALLCAAGELLLLAQLKLTIFSALGI